MVRWGRWVEVGAGGRVRRDHVFAVTTRSKRGVQRVRHARNVVMAIGYYDHPVMIGVPGEDLPHVHHYYGEPHRHYRQRVVIVGGGNSAAESALEMYRAGAHVTIVHRAPSLKSTIKYWVRPDIENRIKEGSVAARFNACVTAIRPASVIVRSDTSRATGQLIGSGPNDASVPAVSNARTDSTEQPNQSAEGSCARRTERRRGNPRRRRLPAHGLPDRRRFALSRRRRAQRSCGPGLRSERRSRQMCRDCSLPAAPSPASTPAPSSSRTAVFTARRSSKSSPGAAGDAHGRPVEASRPMRDAQALPRDGVLDRPVSLPRDSHRKRQICLEFPVGRTA